MSAQSAQQQNKKQGDMNTQGREALDEVKAAAAEIQSDVKSALNDAQGTVSSMTAQIQSKTAGLQSKVRPFLMRQRATARQFYADLFAQSPMAKGLFGALMLTNFALPFLFLNRSEGWIVLLSYICVSALSHALYTLTPKSSPYRLFNSTLSHVVWVPMLFWLSHRMSSNDYHTASKSMDHVDVSVAVVMKKGMLFSAWMMSVLCANTIALGNDIYQLVNILQNEKGQKNIQNVVAKAEQAGEQLLAKATGESQAEKQYAFARQQQASQASKQEGLKQRNVAAPTA